jgi:spermidine synthase
MGLTLRFKVFLMFALVLSLLPLNMIVPDLFSHTGNVIYEKETPYSHLDVVDSKGIRTLYLNGLPHSAMYLNNSNDLVFLYTEMFNLAFAFNSNIQNVLFIGGGGFSTPKYFLENYPDMIIDVVEIDPDVIKVAKDYFNLKKDTRLAIYNRDGRVYITNSNKKYDLIVLDAYSKTYIPFHLMTREFFVGLKKNLVPDGIVVSNIITSLLGDTSDLFRAEYKTISQIFSNLYVFPAYPNFPGAVQNVLLFVSQTSYLSKDRLVENLNHINMSRFINYIENYYEKPIYSEDVPVLTDDYAPVEILLNPVTEKPYQIEYRYF